MERRGSDATGTGKNLPLPNLPPFWGRARRFRPLNVMFQCSNKVSLSKSMCSNVIWLLFHSNRPIFSEINGGKFGSGKFLPVPVASLPRRSIE